MSARALLLAVVLSLSTALIPLFVLVQYDDGALERARAESQRQAQGGAERVRHLLARDASERMRRVKGICARDTGVERLASEAAQGLLTQDALLRVAQTLARATAQRVSLSTTQSGATTLVAESTSLGRMLTHTELERASRGRVAVVAPEGLFFVVACSTSPGRDALWVVLVEPLAAVLSDLASDPDAPIGIESYEAARHPDFASAAVERLSDVEGRALGTIVAYARLSKPAPLLLTPWALLLLALGCGVGLLFARERWARERALFELERAAERVARGDLVSTIELRLGDRADQTFGTFDRMTRELREMRERLRQSEREAALRDVAQRIAHEIKNPLSPIRTGLETLRKAHDKELPEFSEIFSETTRVMLDEVRRIERIVREFAELSRLPEPRLGALDLTSLVRDVLALHSPEGVALSAQLPEHDCQAHADREQLTQVLINLLKNAAEAARERPDPRVGVVLTRERACVTLHVDDSGPGVPESGRAKIFEPYYTTKESGSGLGLSIVQHIVLDHGGSIEVGDSPLGGARLTVRLPLGPREETTSGAQGSATTAPGS